MNTMLASFARAAYYVFIMTAGLHSDRQRAFPKAPWLPERPRDNITPLFHSITRVRCSSRSGVRLPDFATKATLKGTPIFCGL